MQRTNSPRGKRRISHVRAGLALSRLGAMLALAFTPGMQAQGATFTDSITFSTTNQSLWGNSSVADIKESNFLGVSWGTFTGGAASPAFAFNGITDVHDPIFGAYLGSYGLSASLKTSAKIGLDFSTSLRGGSMDYSQLIKPQLTLPDSFKANTAFRVSATDTLNSAAVIKTTVPVVSTYLSATLDFQARLLATGCVVSCTSISEDFGIKTGDMNILSWDPARRPQGKLADGEVSQSLSNKQGRIIINKEGDPFGMGPDVGSYKFADTFDTGNCSSGASSFHCGATLFNGDFNLTAMLAATGKFPLYIDKSVSGIDFKAHILDVALKPDYRLNLDVDVKAPVFTRLQFDKPVTELLSNGDTKLHSDGVVSFALGKGMDLRFGAEVGKLVKRSYYMDEAVYDTTLTANAKLDLDSKVACGVRLSAFGMSVVPDTSNECARTDYLNLAATGSNLYGATNRLNSIRTTGQYQGGGSFSELSLKGVYGVNEPIINTGSGSVARVELGSLAYVNGLGASFNNKEFAKTFVAGTLKLDGGSALDNGAGAELIIEAGGQLMATYGGSAGISYLYNREAADGRPAGLITNLGLVDIRTRVVNRGVINNSGTFDVTDVGRFEDSYGGVFNNMAGGVLHIDNAPVLGDPYTGTFNLLAGSTVLVTSYLSVASNYKQVNAGTIRLTSTGIFAIFPGGELQLGDGGTTGNLVGATVRNAGVLSFNRSDDLSFAAAVEGTGELHKRNANTLTVTSGQLYTGRTLVDGGRLVLQGQNASSEFRIAKNAVLELNTPTERLNTSNNKFTGGGTLLKTGRSTMAWTTTSAVFAMDAGSLIEVREGNFQAGSYGNENWELNKSALTVASGATFSGVEANVRVDALNGSGGISSGFAGAGYKTFSFGVAGGSGSFAGILSDTQASAGHVGSFTKEGAGTQILTAANSFTGPLSILGGTLQVGEGGTSGSLATKNILDNGELIFSRSDDLAYAGAINGSGNLTKFGAGQLLLQGNNSYAGITSIKAGRLVLEGATGSRLFDIGQGSTLELRLSNGTQDNLKNTQFSGMGTLLKTGPSTVQWGQASAVFAMDKGSLIEVREGLFLGGSHLNDDWRLNKSALKVASGARFNGAEANIRVDALSGGGTISSGYSTRSAGTSYKNFSFGVANGSGIFDGVLADASTAAGNIANFVKEGSGTQTLNGINTYTGSTTVQAGELVLNGSALASAFTVNGGAVLSGSGALGSLALAGQVSPGNSPGKLRVQGSASFAAGASYRWEMADATGLAGVGFDLLDIGGTLSLNASAAQPFTVALKSLLASGAAGSAKNFDARHDHSYILAYAAGGILGFGSDEFSIDGTGFANALQGGAWSISADNNALKLNFTALAVPEPETLVLFLGGLLAVGGIARRRQARSGEGRRA